MQITGQHAEVLKFEIYMLIVTPPASTSDVQTLVAWQKISPMASHLIGSYSSPWQPIQAKAQRFSVRYVTGSSKKGRPPSRGTRSISDDKSGSHLVDEVITG